MGATVEISVDAKHPCGVQEHYWRYVGYDECNYTYIPEGRELLRKFASLEKEPYYFRTHFMFCTGNCRGTYKFGSTNLYTEDAQGNPVYDYTVYDRVIDTYLEVGAKPFVELGFMPMDLADPNYQPADSDIWQKYNHYKNDGWTCPPKSYEKWRDLISHLASHLKEKYGEGEVGTWYYELWNEPDIFYWKGTPAEYFKLYDYTELALHEILPDARLSGPATTSPIAGGSALAFLEAFLEHCRSGVNFATGKTGTRVDFLTFHVKGGGFPFALRPQKENPSIAYLVDQVKTGLDCMVKHGYGDRELVLSEADPDGWAAGGMYDNPNMVFRNTEYYASYVASAFHKIESLSAQYGVRIRPLSWAFLFPDERCFEGTRTFSTQGIDKPVFNLFRMFGMLGYAKLPVTAAGSEEADVSGFAVRGENGETQILLYSHHDDRDRDGAHEVTLAIRNLDGTKSRKVRHYRIDACHSNAYAEWLRQGSPWYPDNTQYAAIKARDGLELLPDTAADSDGESLTLRFSMPEHAVSLIVIG